MSSVLERPEQNHAHMIRAAAPVFRRERDRGNKGWWLPVWIWNLTWLSDFDRRVSKQLQELGCGGV